MFSLLLYALALGTKYGVRKFGFAGSASQLSRIFLFLDSLEMHGGCHACEGVSSFKVLL